MHFFFSIITFVVAVHCYAEAAPTPTPFFVLSNNGFCSPDQWSCIRNSTECLALQVNMCTALLFTAPNQHRVATNYSSLIVHPASNGVVPVSIYGDDYCGHVLMNVTAPASLAKHAQTTYYQTNDQQWHRRDYKYTCYAQ